LLYGHICACAKQFQSSVCTHACQCLCIQLAPGVPCVFRMRGKLSVFACVGVSWEHSRSSYFGVSLKNTLILDPSFSPNLSIHPVQAFCCSFPPSTPCSFFLSFPLSITPGLMRLTSVPLLSHTHTHAHANNQTQATQVHTLLYVHMHTDTAGLTPGLCSARPLPSITLTLCQEASGRVIMTSVCSPYR